MLLVHSQNTLQPMNLFLIVLWPHLTSSSQTLWPALWRSCGHSAI